jgi:serine-type D-Ala-D-Ala carboxypeptidase (penicillin-binding protein 5/6)
MRIKRYCHPVQLSRLISLAVAGVVAAAGVTGCTAAASTTGHVAAGHGQPPAAGQSAASSPSAKPAEQGFQPAHEASGPSRVKAKAAALVDVDTDQLLWSRGLNRELPMGSITKVMTALLVIKAGDLNRQIRIPHAVLNYVAKYQGESAGLRPGDVLTPHELLQALLIESGCDAAYVLATTYGPGIPAFLTKMNAMAAQLGMTQTHFTSPDGLPYPTEYSTYSTPADLLKLGVAAMKLAVFRSIVDQTFYHLRKTRKHHSYWWDNTNSLIGNYPGADGIKTGYTDAAKHCLLFEAMRHGTTLIGVVLGSPVTGPFAADQAAARMLNWGFSLKLAAGH